MKMTGNSDSVIEKITSRVVNRAPSFICRVSLRSLMMLRASTINSTIKAMTFRVESANKIRVPLAVPGVNHCSVLKACNTSNEAESRRVATANTITRLRRAERRGLEFGSEVTGISYISLNYPADSNLLICLLPFDLFFLRNGSVPSAVAGG